LRIELAVKSRKKAKKYNIEFLSDLAEPDKLNIVKTDFLKVWKEMIFHDKGIKWREMTNSQQKKWLYYLDQTNWEKFTRIQRTRAKKHFLQLKNEFSTSYTQENILFILEEKLKELEAVECNGLRFFFNEYDSHHALRITHMNKLVKRYHFDPKNSTFKNPEKSVKIKHQKCKICEQDISHKKNGSIYCSKKCNNASQAKRRRKSRRQNTTIENNNLKSIIKTISDIKMRFTITYKQKNLTYSKNYLQDDVSLSREELKAIKSLYIKQPHNITLTSYRARKLIKTIATSNNSTT